MDLAFSKEEMAFRKEVRAFFRDHVPPADAAEAGREPPAFQDEMVAGAYPHKKGWGVTHWPVEYGGTGGLRSSTTSSTKSCRCIRRQRRSPSASAWSVR